MSRLDFITEPLANIPNGLVVRLEGNIDATSALEFSNKLDELIEQGTRHFVFDLERVMFVNSTGMGLLVRAADKTNQTGGSFVLVKIHPKVKIVFEMLGLDQFFETFASQAKALEYIEKRADGSVPAGSRRAAAASGSASASASAARTVPPPPAAPSPRRAPVAAMPPPPAAPSPRGGAPQAAPMMSTANLPRTDGGGIANLQAFIAMPSGLQHYGIIYSFVQAACVGAQVIAKRMDPNPAAHPRNLADLTAATFVLVDFTPVNGQIDPQVLQYAQTARYQMDPPKQLICLVQGRKENLPAEWANLPTVPYHASQQGMQYLKQYLEKGLKTLVARRTG